MQNPQDYVPVVTTVLAIGTALGPVMFGFTLWKMSQIFVTKSQFDEYKSQAHEERIEMRNRLLAIENNTSELLQRTARFK